MTKPYQNNHKKFWLAGFSILQKIYKIRKKTYLEGCEKFENLFFAEEMLCLLLVLNHFVVSRFVQKLVLCSSYLIKFSKKNFGPHNFLRFSWVEIYENKNFICFCLSLRTISNFWSCENKLAHCARVNVKNWHVQLKS